MITVKEHIDVLLSNNHVWNIHKHKNTPIERTIDLQTSQGRLRMVEARVIGRNSRGEVVLPSVVEFATQLDDFSAACRRCGSYLYNLSIIAMRATGPVKFNHHMFCPLEMALLWMAQPELGIDEDLAIEIKSGFAKFLWVSKETK